MINRDGLEVVFVKRWFELDGKGGGNQRSEYVTVEDGETIQALVDRVLSGTAHGTDYTASIRIHLKRPQEPKP